MGDQRPSESILDRAAKIANHPFCAWSCLAAVCALVAYMVMLPIRNYDLGWHVALGRYTVENLVVPTSEPFTHTAQGAPMVAHEWLSQVVYYLVYDSADVIGLRWMHAGVVALILVVLFVCFRRQGTPPAPALVGTFLFIVIAQDRFQIRPHLFDLLWLVVMYGVVFLARPKLTVKQLVGIFLAVVVWVNMHSGAILFPTIVVLYVVVEALQQATGWRRPRPSDIGGGSLRRLAALAGLAVVALVVTPNHVRLFPYVVESKRLNAVYSQEWSPITSFLGPQFDMKPFSVEMYLIMLVATVLTALLVIRRQSASLIAVVLFLAVLPLTGLRFTAACFAPVLFVFSEFPRWATRKVRGVVLRERTSLLNAVIVVGVVAVLASAPFVMNHQGRLFRYKDRLDAFWNFQPALFPIGAVGFLEQVDLEGELFNSSDWGGYILLRLANRYPVFIDGRWVTIGERIFRDSLTIERRGAGAFEKIDEYDIDILLVRREWMTKGLQKETNWMPIFENFNAGIYVRNSPESAENLRRCAAYYRSQGIPFDLSAGFDEHAAFLANREWAEIFHVRQRHLGLKPGSGTVAGW